MIIDAFPYFNEINLLHIRLKYLGPYVDQFLIFEASVDFSGKTKNLNLTQELVSKLPYAHKIKIVQWTPNSRWEIKYLEFIGKIRFRKGLWGIQNKQRNSIAKELKTMNPRDILIFGDLDEFPDVEILSNRDRLISMIETNEIMSFRQILYYYNVYTVMTDNWKGTAICSIDYARKNRPSKIRKYRQKYPVIGNGWHFSYFFDPAEILKKINAIADVENLSDKKSLTTSDITESIKNSRDVYNRPYIFGKYDSNTNVPADLLKLFQEYIPNSVNSINTTSEYSENQNSVSSEPVE